MLLDKKIRTMIKERLREDLRQLTPKQVHIFRRMYAKNFAQTIETTLDNMEDSELNWCMTQVSNTIDDNKRNNVEGGNSDA